MTIKVVIKGSKRIARRAAAKHGASVKRCTDRHLVSTTECEVSCAKFDAVDAWYRVRVRSHPAKLDRGLPSGQIVYYRANCKR